MALDFNLLAVLPELGLLCLASLLLVTDAFLPRIKLLAAEKQDKLDRLDNLEFKNYKLTFYLSQAVLLIILFLVFYQNYILTSATDITNNSINNSINNLINNMIINDKLSYILKIFMITSVLISFYYSENFLKNYKIFSGEYFVMGLFSLLGMMVLVSSLNLITLYLGLELFSLPVYAMIAMQRKSEVAGEAALKYFVMGSLASGILLFGMSIIYGMSGSLVLSDIYNYSNIANPAYILGLIFICVGIAFKFGAAPFHMWIPDVYQGAPTPVTLFIAVAPKLAAFGMAIRLLHDGFNSSAHNWGYVLFLLALLSVAWGSIGALAQTNFKRLLAYSGISHIGFILLGLVAAASTGVSLSASPVASSNLLANINFGYASALFYVIVYAITSLAIFGFILMYGNSKYELTNLVEFKGLYYKQPWLALMLLMLLFSMAGVPPFVGFFAKMAIIQSILAAGYYYSAVFVVLFSVIGAFYYLKLIWLMFFEDPEPAYGSVLNQASGQIALDLKILVSINCLLVLVLGISSQWLFAWCASVF